MNKNIIFLSVSVIVITVVFVLAINNTDHTENKAANALIIHIKNEIDDPIFWSNIALYSYPTTCQFGEKILGSR